MSDLGVAPVRGVYRPNLRSPAFCGKNGQPTELAEQFGLVQWCRVAHPGVRFFAVPNGGKRDVTEAAMKLMEGLSKGVPDLWFPHRREAGGTAMWAGLVIEMKRAKSPAESVGSWHGVGGWGGAVVASGKWSAGVVSPEQQEWLLHLGSQGYMAIVCNGMQEAMAAVNWYFTPTL